MNTMVCVDPVGVNAVVHQASPCFPVSSNISKAVEASSSHVTVISSTDSRLGLPRLLLPSMIIVTASLQMRSEDPFCVSRALVRISFRLYAEEHFQICDMVPALPDSSEPI